MHVAIVGTRGVPANYGGFETFAEEFGSRLVERGHKVTVYCRSSSYESGEWESLYRGMQRRRVWSPRSKYLETVASSFVGVLDAAANLNPDVVLLVNGINAWCSFIPRLKGIPTYLNVDGVERQRTKWHPIGRLAYRVSERLSTWFPTAFVSDAEWIRDYYQRAYGHDSVVLAYGADPIDRSAPTAVAPWGLTPDEYVLFVSRLEPENGALDVIDAYRAAPDLDWPLVIVGDAPYANAYKATVASRAASDSRVHLLGAVYGDGYQGLRGGAGIYIQATSVGGTHPALLEGMAAGNVVVARETPEHREVLGDAGVYFRTTAELSEALRQLRNDPALRRQLSAAALERVTTSYSWDAVVTGYERLMSSAAKQR